jgi:hypothetical protein
MNEPVKAAGRELQNFLFKKKAVFRCCFRLKQPLCSSCRNEKESSGASFIFSMSGTYCVQEIKSSLGK